MSLCVCSYWQLQQLPGFGNLTLDTRCVLVQGKSGQAPPAIVLSCSDSRVPPEMVLDQGIGDVFVIRYDLAALGQLYRSVGGCFAVEERALQATTPVCTDGLNS